MRIRKAVIAVAGYGTRFLPATKAQPKEMLPICEKPVVQHLVEEVVASGIEDIILVTRAGSNAVEDHFDSSRELELHLEEQGKTDYLRQIQAIPQQANFAFVRQGRHLPYGNASPLLAAKHYLDEGEPFVYMFGDDLVFSQTPCVKQLTDVYKQYGPAAVIAFQEVPANMADRFGMAKVKQGTQPPELESIVEKPAPKDAPSRLAQLGRFVLPWRTIEILDAMSRNQSYHATNELYLTHANDILCREARVLAHGIEGKWITTGDLVSFLIANIEYALQHEDPEISRGVTEYLRTLDLGK